MDLGFELVVRFRMATNITKEKQYEIMYALEEASVIKPIEVPKSLQAIREEAFRSISSVRPSVKSFAGNMFETTNGHTRHSSDYLSHQGESQAIDAYWETFRKEYSEWKEANHPGPV